MSPNPTAQEYIQHWFPKVLQESCLLLCPWGGLNENCLFVYFKILSSVGGATQEGKEHFGSEPMWTLVGRSTALGLWGCLALLKFLVPLSACFLLADEMGPASSLFRVFSTMVESLLQPSTIALCLSQITTLCSKNGNSPVCCEAVVSVLYL